MPAVGRLARLYRGPEPGVRNQVCKHIFLSYESLSGPCMVKIRPTGTDVCYTLGFKVTWTRETQTLFAKLAIVERDEPLFTYAHLAVDLGSRLCVDRLVKTKCNLHRRRVYCGQRNHFATAENEDYIKRRFTTLRSGPGTEVITQELLDSFGIKAVPFDDCIGLWPAGDRVRDDAGTIYFRRVDDADDVALDDLQSPFLRTATTMTVSE